MWKKVKLICGKIKKNPCKTGVFLRFYKLRVENLVNFSSEWFDASILFTLLFSRICYDFNMSIAVGGVKGPTEKTEAI